MESVHVVCPNCAAVNRVVREKATQGPTCGRCKNNLLPGRPVSLTMGTFSKYVSRNELPVLVDFWSPTCGPCQMMNPAFDQAAGILHPSVLLAKVDTMQEQQIALYYNIMSVPQLIMFKGGQIHARSAGAMDAQNIVRWAQSHA